MKAPRLHTFATRCVRFARTEKGAVAPLLGLMMLVLIGCMGISVDIGRSMIVKARLVDALDAAGLAVGARTATTDYTGDALKYVSSNFKTQYAGATVTSVTAVPNNDKTIITLTATATMPTAFMKLFGSSSVTVNATSEITRASTGLELALVLDNTGSMEMSGSMPGLKTAANSLIDQLFGGQSTAKNLYIGLVPFSQAVNIGVGNALWTDINTVTRAYYPTNWTGCVEARKNNLDVTDDPPTLLSNKIFTAYYSPDSNQNDWIRSFYGIPYTQIFYTDYTNNGQLGPAAYCPTAITPLTNKKDTIKAGVTAMKAWGSTMINEGAVWGWRLLSPSWRGFWTGGDMLTNSLPLDYGTKNMSKAVVIMTDGENSFGANNYTAYGLLSEGRLGTTQQSAAEDVLDTRLTTVCTKMKQAGIIVFTVAYDNPAKATKTLLQNCATNTSYYFDAGNTTDLLANFKTIASALSNLRVSK